MQNDENSTEKSEIEDKDKSLHRQFLKLGNDRRKLTNELLALLPEINERGIFKKYSGSIIEYAGKFGGLSKGVVLKRLRLEKYLKDKLKLKETIKTEGIHKVAMVASLATLENEDFIVDKIKNMSKEAVQELSKEMRANDEGKKMDQNLFGETIETVSCKAAPQKITIELDEEMSFLFLKMKKKIGKNLINKEVMKKVLEIVGSELNKTSTDRKVIPGDNFSTRKPKIDITDYTLAKPITRYIPSSIKKQIISKTNGKCSYPNCNKPADIFHYAERFAAKPSHDSLRLLCKVHHEFAHNGLIKNEMKDARQWNLDLYTGTVGQIDNQYRQFRLQ